MIRRLLGIAVALAALAGCGGASGPLAAADDHLAGLDAGTIDLSLTAAGTGRPVGFSMEGTFDSTGDGDYPVLDMTYSRLLGGSHQTSRLRSDGSEVTVTSGGQTIVVPDEQLDSLRLGDGDGGVGDLGIDGWVADPKTGDTPSGKVVTGRVDVADFLSDLARVMAGVRGEADIVPPEGAAADRLDALVESSQLRAVLDDDDHLRSLEATVRFAARSAARLRPTLGDYTGASLRLRLKVDGAP